MSKNNMPDENELTDSLGKIAYTLDKAYMARLKDDYSIIPFDEYIESIKNNNGYLEFETNISIIKVKRFVYNTDELIRDGFKNILSLFSGGFHNIALIIRRTPKEVNIYYALKNDKEASSSSVRKNSSLLKSSLTGNFNGTEVDTITEGEKNTLLNFDNTHSISILCGIPSEKSENYISQGLEKLLNGIVPKTDNESYTCIINAQPMSVIELRNILNGYENIASALTPFATKQSQYGSSVTKTDGKMNSKGHSTGTAHAKTSSHNLGTAVSAGMSMGFSVFGSASVGYGGSSVSAGASSSVTTNIGINTSYGYSFGASNTDSINDTLTVGTNKSLSSGESESISFTHKSYLVSDLIEKLEATIKRINESQATGLWQTAIYTMSENNIASKNVANFLNSIMQGDESYLEPPYIQTWYKAGEEKDKDFDDLLKYIRHISHPIFSNKYNEIKVIPTANVSTTELSNLIALPRYSVQGLPVISCPSFGREPHSLIKHTYDVDIGNSYHMYLSNSNNRISISKKEITSHIFITGSTGAGKSNTIFILLNKMNTNFLVIEPAKGEYKDIFGGRNDVHVYGTNPRFTELLRINPLAFPANIAVSEHIDRLIEIFNVCWPMYAAMPAILKDAVIRAYEVSGWDMTTSENKYNSMLFPTFSDVLEQIKIVLKESEYSSDNKGDYTGALVTRLKSLTNGINGQIFSSNGLSDTELFDGKVIVDMSRIGSNETKSMIMALLVMKLQEYRLSEGKPDNSELNHITVLEEAHHILRRTSSEQRADTANLIGKSIEMLANAIAELRSFGEGFIIADQAPGLLDMAVIRNTNTKIIHRLPDQSDRELVGKSAGLNDEQIKELAKLELGVAAVYQNDWIEPVLCKIDQFDEDVKKPLSYIPHSIDDSCTEQAKRMITDLLIKPHEKVKVDYNCILKAHISARIKVYAFIVARGRLNSIDAISQAEAIVELNGRYSELRELPNKDKIRNFVEEYFVKYNYSDIQNERLVLLYYLSQLDMNDPDKIKECCSSLSELQNKIKGDK